MKTEEQIDQESQILYLRELMGLGIPKKNQTAKEKRAMNKKDKEIIAQIRVSMGLKP